MLLNRAIVFLMLPLFLMVLSTDVMAQVLSGSSAARSPGAGINRPDAP